MLNSVPVILIVSLLKKTNPHISKQATSFVKAFLVMSIMFFHVLQAAGALVLNKLDPFSALIIMYVKYVKVTEVHG